MPKKDNCCFPHCRNGEDIIWLKKSICNKHWNWVCEVPIERAYKKLNVDESVIKENEAFKIKKEWLVN